MSVDVFFSYAHEDEKLCKRLETHLTLLKRQGIISTWNDRNISAGREWKREVDAHLNTAQFILLLISPDFAASEYCYSVEMKRAMERHERGEARVIPIILRPVAHWQEAPFGKLKALPTNGKPMTDRYWHTQDEALFQVVQEISQAIGDVVAEKNGVSPTSRGSNSASSDPGSGAASHSQVISDPPVTLMDQRMMEPTPAQAESKQLDMVASPPPNLPSGPSNPARVGQDKHALSTPQWKKKRQLAVLITCSILLLVLVGLALHYSFPIPGLGQHLVTKSSTPFPPTPVDSPGAFPPPGATPVFQDALHDGGSGKFGTYSSSSGACLFTQGAYYVSSPDYDSSCDGSFTLPQNLAIQVTMTFIPGPGGGIAIGQATASSTGPDTEAFLNPNGSYELVQGITQLVTNTTPLIKRGIHATNVIAIVARSHRIDLYINGQYIDHATANFASPQSVRLFVTTVEDHAGAITARSQSEVAFKDLTIWKL